MNVNSTSAQDNSRVFIGNNHINETVKDPEDDVWKYLKALCLSDPFNDREKLKDVKKRVPGTCEWIKDNPIYQSWLSKKSDLMWIHGDPGQGKTVLALYLVEELEAIASTNQGSSVYYYFCNGQLQGRNTALAILRGIMFQILRKHHKLARHFKPHFDFPGRGDGSGVTSSLSHLWLIFEKLIDDSGFGPTRCVIDGLDECETELLPELLDGFIKICTEKTTNSAVGNVQFIFISRNSHNLRKLIRLPDHLKIDLKREYSYHTVNDVDRFISVKLDDLSDIENFDKVRPEVAKELSNKSEGTFLWVGHVIDQVSKSETCHDILPKIQGLPKDLHNLYHQIIEKIPLDHRQACQKILQWVVLARRPLYLFELASAIDISPAHGLSAKDICIALIKHCRQLVYFQETTDPWDQTVHLLHQSVQDFLLETGSEFRIDLKRSHISMAQICIQNMVAAVSPIRMASILLAAYRPIVRENTTLLGYAFYSWDYHLTLSDTTYEESIKLADPILQILFNEMEQFLSYPAPRRFIPSVNKVDTAFLGVRFGIYEWVQGFLESAPSQMSLSIFFNIKDQVGIDVLRRAFLTNRKRMVELLVKYLPKEMEAYYEKDRELVNILRDMIIFYRDLVSVRKILRLELVQKSILKHGALLLGFTIGNIEKTRLFLEEGRNLARDRLGIEDKRIFYEKIFSPSNRPETQNYYYPENSALENALFQDRIETVKLLVEYGADFNFRDPLTKSSLLNISLRKLGSYQMVEYLLGQMPISGNEAETYLEDAVRGFLPMIQLFLNRGANLHLISENGSILHYAAQLQPQTTQEYEKYKKLVVFLLSEKVEFGARDEEGYTALELGAEIGNIEFVRHVLDYEPKPIGLDDQVREAMCAAATVELTWKEYEEEARKGRSGDKYWDIAKMLMEYEMKNNPNSDARRVLIEMKGQHWR